MERQPTGRRQQVSRDPGHKESKVLSANQLEPGQEGQFGRVEPVGQQPYQACGITKYLVSRIPYPEASFMNHGNRRIAWPAAPLLVGLAFASSLTAQQLEIGGVVSGSTSDMDVADFPFPASSAGVLTVAVRSTDETDLILVVTDADGQPLPEGRSDQDMGGNTGAEQFAVTIPRAGSYRVRVERYGSGTAAFRLGASWVAFPALEVPPDPDGSPSSATPIRIGQAVMQESLNGKMGDYWDWYVFSANQSGTLTVATRAEEGDLVIEAFEEGSYGEPMERSDQDLQEKGGNEALTLIVTRGQRLYFKVSAFDEGAEIAYRLQVGFMPE
jgi:hypothetical protein